MPSSTLEVLRQAGVAIWLDGLSREMIASGRLGEYVRERLVSGVTSNPTILANVLTAGDDYDDQLRAAVRAGEREPRELFFAVALRDVRDAARELAGVYRRTGGRDGFVCFECTPDVAADRDATVAQAQELWGRLASPNVMIKVPATDAGVDAISQLTRSGVNVNATLLFGEARYRAVLDAYMRGLEMRLDEGLPLHGVASVASFFVSRIDAKVDPFVAEPLRGTVAIACASAAYKHFRDVVAGPRWRALAAAGARPQRLLWASTKPKNPFLRDTLYVEELVGDSVVSTMAPDTLEAFADHGETRLTLPGDGGCEVLRDVGIDLEQVARELEQDGLQAFCGSYEQLLDSVRRWLHVTVS